MLHTVGHRLGLRQRAALGKMHLHSKAVAVGLRQHLYLQTSEKEAAERDGADGQHDDNGRMPEAVGQHLVVLLLQEYEEPVLRRLEAVRCDTVFVPFDENR